MELALFVVNQTGQLSVRHLGQLEAVVLDHDVHIGRAGLRVRVPCRLGVYVPAW